jgi:RNA polymerase sigma factor (sigma-70 family)
MKTIFIIDNIPRSNVTAITNTGADDFPYNLQELFSADAINGQIFRQDSESKLESSSTAPSRKRLAEIFVRERMRFLRFVQWQLFEQDAMEAEDIVSDVLFGLLRRADVIGEIENLSVCLYSSLTNRVTDHHRGASPEVRIDDAEEDGTQKAELAGKGPAPEKVLEQQELQNRLSVAIGRLSPPERAVWLATEIDGFTLRDLAEEWDESIGTLLSRKSRAVAKLRQQLSGYRPKGQGGKV